jgi:hypothetical protein
MAGADAFWRKLVTLVPCASAAHKCPALRLAVDFGGRFKRGAGGRPAMLAEFMNDWKRVSVVQKWWMAKAPRRKSLVDAFKAGTVEPFVEAWRHHVYRIAISLLTGARAFYADERRRANVVNYVDLLLVTARLLRENESVRRALQRKYRWFFIDEFQDTDPIQAEIFLLPPPRAKAGPWRRIRSGRLAPGALFVVGDPSSPSTASAAPTSILHSRP